MNEEKRKTIAHALAGIQKKEWEFICKKIESEFASATLGLTLKNDAEALGDLLKDTWNEN